MGRQPPQTGGTPHLARSGRLGFHGAMHELMRTNDLILLGAVEALLVEAGYGGELRDE